MGSYWNSSSGTVELNDFSILILFFWNLFQYRNFVYLKILKGLVEELMKKNIILLWYPKKIK